MGILTRLLIELIEQSLFVLSKIIIFTVTAKTRIGTQSTIRQGEGTTMVDISLKKAP